MSETKLLTREQVAEKLKQMKSGGEIPDSTRGISIITLHQGYPVFHPVAVVVVREPGNLDYYSEENVEKIMDFGKKNGGLVDFI